MSGPHTAVVIDQEPFDSAPSQWVVRQAMVELEARYGIIDEGEYQLSAAQFDPPQGAFLVAHPRPQPHPRPGGDPVGGVGVRGITPHIGEIIGEIKRLWLHPDWRGQGIARALMGEIEVVARRLGHTQLRLETGEMQPEAVALYASLGWSRQDEAWEGGPIRCGSIHFSKHLA